MPLGGNREYERFRPLVQIGEPVPERAAQTGTSERTLYRRISGFEENGLWSLLGSEPAKIMGLRCPRDYPPPRPPLWLRQRFGCALGRDGARGVGA